MSAWETILGQNTMRAIERGFSKMPPKQIAIEVDKADVVRTIIDKVNKEDYKYITHIPSTENTLLLIFEKD